MDPTVLPAPQPPSDVSFARLLRAGLTATLLALAVGACSDDDGGGGDDNDSGDTGDGGDSGDSGGGDAPVEASARIERIRYDLDANGVFEYERTFDYDAEGRLTSITDHYVDDGTPDAANVEWALGTTPEDGAQTLFEYDDDRVVRYVQQNSEERIVLDVTHDADGLPSAFEFAFYDDTGALVTLQTSNDGDILLNEQGQVSSVDSRLESFVGGGASFDYGWTLGFDADGRVDESRIETSAGGPPVVFGYQWDAAARLSQAVDTAGFSIVYAYDADGLTQSKTVTDPGASGASDETRTETYGYDGDRVSDVQVDIASDGDVDALAEVDWTDADCVPPVLWVPGGLAEPARPADPESALLNGTGFVQPVLFGHCAD